MIKDKLVKLLKEITEAKEINLEFPDNPEFGDFTTNIALVSAKDKGESPRKVAEEIVKKLGSSKDLSEIVEKIDIAGPGFINFWLKHDVLVSNLIQIDTEKEKYGTSNIGKGKVWGIEHTSPNPNKAMHLGHLRNNVTGMAISNLAETMGFKVIRDCVDNDRGIAIAKLMWGYLKFAKQDGGTAADINYWFDNQGEWRTPEDLGLRPDRFVDQLYVKGSTDFEADKNVEELVRKMVVDWEAGEPKIWALWKKVLDYSYKGQEMTLTRLGNKWDRVWHEHEHYKQGKEMVEDGLKKGIFKKLKDGAIITDLSKFNLTDTIVMKSDGTALYITQDLALTKLKKETFKADRLFWVIGPEQSLAMQQMFAVCEQLGIGKKKDFTHLVSGYMSIKGQGKMSSRLGNVVYIDELLDLAKGKVKKIMDGSDFKADEMEEIAENVGIGAVKYSILKVCRVQDIAFDINESVSVEGNSGPYLQYTVARINSVLAKSTSKDKVLGSDDSNLNDEELTVLRSLIQFSGVLELALKSYFPNLICNYLFELAQKYNHLYNSHKIVGGDNEKFDLALSAGVVQVLKNGLKILGIKTPERM